MDIIIIEDEKPAARRLKRLLEDFGLHTNTMLHSVKESVAWFKENKHPDLIFLDIQLSDGLSFEIFEQVEITSSIIFTTAYDEYALKAFKLNSIDYLLKPIDDDELEVAIEKFKKNNQQAANPQIDLSQIQQLLSNPFEKNYKKRFTVKVGQHLKVIQVSDIECFYSENKSTYIFTNEKRNYLLDIPLEQLENQLEEDVFFRVNRKFFVNINSIKDIVSYTNSRLKLVLENYDEEEIIVSREKVKKFKEWLG
ncbi:LytR/AlgR family response regulator transcription factor [Aureivirga marina]|uniref:LytR/AlgR family response regulator transcription factor n=1 Tax=Aureivirga marina TaxID=1182451 RepID=UPI0018C9A770|nr:LytTR family DNA-binding domain-containing protein [Aureivirga marina]